MGVVGHSLQGDLARPCRRIPTELMMTMMPIACYTLRSIVARRSFCTLQHSLANVKTDTGQKYGYKMLNTFARN